MSIQLYLAFIFAATLLIAIPGPNVALIVANSVAYGVRYGLLTVAGTTSAMIILLALTYIGLNEMLGTMAHWFEWLRWLGVAYLIYLGLRQWFAAPADLSQVHAQPKSLKVMVLRGFFVSLTNPKTLLFYGAFFPQFIDTNKDAGPQVLLMSATFLVIAVALDSTWAPLAGQLRFVLNRHAKWRNRISGTLLAGAALGLALARRK